MFHLNVHHVCMAGKNKTAGGLEAKKRGENFSALLCPQKFPGG
jgi:hypothetical protein